MIPQQMDCAGRSLVSGRCFSRSLSLCHCILLAAGAPDSSPSSASPPQARTNGGRVASSAGRIFGREIGFDLKKQTDHSLKGARANRSVGSREDVPIPPGTDVLDLTNATVLPG